MSAAVSISGAALSICLALFPIMLYLRRIAVALETQNSAAIAPPHPTPQEPEK